MKQMLKLVNGKINMKEFIIAKEYRGRNTYANPQSIAACQVANKLLVRDPLGEPLTGERVPYLVVYGMPGQALYELVRSPHDLVENPDLKLNYEYFAVKQILPPLNRIFLLMGVNVFDWVRSISFKQKIFHFINETAAGGGSSSTAAAVATTSGNCSIWRKCPNRRAAGSERS